MVSSVNGSSTPVIPGIAGLGNLPAVAAYASIIKKGELKELAAVASAPQVAKEQRYFEVAISRMDNVDDLLKDRRALKYLLTSYGLGSEISKTGIIKKVLTEDPSQTRSLVNGLADGKWKTMAVDLDTYYSGLGKLKGDVTKDSFSLNTVGNRYLSLLQQDALGNVTNSFYGNNFDLSVLANGKIGTPDGLTLAGYKLDNRGKVQTTDPNSANNTVNVLSAKLDSKGINVTVGLDQVLTRISGDNWQWTVRNGSKPVVSQQVEIKFAADGSILSVDGSTNKTKSVTVSWGADGSTQQKFDLEQVFKDTQSREVKAVQVNWFDGKKTATNVITPFLELNKNQAVGDPDFFSKVVTKSISNPNKAIYTSYTDDPQGHSLPIKNKLVKGDGDTWHWTVKNGETTLLERDVDLTFNPDGTLATIDGVPATTSTETLDWGGQGTTSSTINLQQIFDKSVEKSEVVLKQTLTRVSGDTWQWQITKGTDVLQTENVDLTFNTNGTLATVNGEYTTSRDATLNFGSYVGDVDESFDLGGVFRRGDFTQLIRVTDNIGVDRNVRIDYNRTGDPENRWQAKIWYEDGGKLAATVDFRFDANGKVIGVGQYDPNTGNIVGENGRQSQKTFDFKIDWERNQGYSELTLDFEKIFSNGSVNIEASKTKTDSVVLGKRKGVDVDLDGNVIATYAKADGTGDIKVNLYRLMANTFDQPNSLRKDDKTGFFTAGAAAGNVKHRPLGTDKDFFGNALDGFAGQLGKPAKTTSTKTVIEVIANGYNQNIFEQALGEENIALRYAVYFKNNASKIKNVYNVLGDRALRDVFSTVFNIPERVATQSLAAQEAVFSRKIDFKKFQDPKFVDQFIQRFLAMSKTSQGSQASSYQSALLTGGDAGSLLSLVGQNLNVLT